MAQYYWKIKLQENKNFRKLLCAIFRYSKRSINNFGQQIFINFYAFIITNIFSVSSFILFFLSWPHLQSNKYTLTEKKERVKNKSFWEEPPRSIKYHKNSEKYIVIIYLLFIKLTNLRKYHLTLMRDGNTEAFINLL